MKLSNNVVYREYLDQTFIMDTRNRCTYNISAPVKKLLDLFADDTTADAAKKKLASIFPHIPNEVLNDDVDATVHFLLSNDLCESSDKKAVLNNARANTRFFQRYTIKNLLLFSALFELTYRCPERCVHCYLEPDSCAKKYIDNAANELSTEKIKEILDQLSELNVMEITFTGGEPFARADIFDILEHADRKHFSINIFSNAILLSDSDINRLSRLRINCFHSSIYSHIPEKHDSVTRVRGSFDRTVGALRKLSANGIYVNLKYVLMECNKSDFDGVVDLAGTMGASVQLIAGISPSVNGNCELADLSVCNDEDLKCVLAKWNAISDYRCFNGEYSDNDPICEAGRNCLCIDPYGQVKPCNAFDYVVGNVNKASISDIWNQSKELKAWQNTTKADLTGCFGCENHSLCSFCPGNALIYTGDMFQKYDFACRCAKIQRELSSDHTDFRNRHS